MKKLFKSLGAPQTGKGSYRFLAAMYHPENNETGDAEKFRIVTEAWRTLSDADKRAAYDMDLDSDGPPSTRGH